MTFDGPTGEWHRQYVPIRSSFIPRMSHRSMTSFLLVATLCLTFLAGVVPSPSVAVNGGSPSSPFGPNDYVSSVVAAPDGGFYVGGHFTHWGVQTGGLGSFAADDGAVDSYFPWVNGTIEAIESDGIGGWFIGGYFDLVGGYERDNLAHINSDGEVTAFAPTTDDLVIALARVGSTLFVGGRFLEVQNQGSSADLPRNLLAAVDTATGEWLDWDPQVDGMVLNTYNTAVFALHSRANTLYVGGNFSDVNIGTRATPNFVTRTGAAAFNVTALGTNKGLSSTWFPNLDGPALAFADRGGVLVVGGDFENVDSGEWDGTTLSPGPLDRISLAEIWPEGSAHPGYANDLSIEVTVDYGTMFPGAVFSLAVEPTTNNVVVGGSFSDISVDGGANFIARENLFAYDSAGAAMSFNPGPDGWLEDLAFDSAGYLYLAGAFGSIGAVTRVGAARLGTGLSSTVDLSFDAGLDDDVNALAITAGPDESIVLGGRFNVANAAAVGPIVKVTAAGVRDEAFTSPVDPNTGVTSLVSWNNKLYAGLYIYDPGPRTSTFELRSFDAGTGSQLAIVSETDSVINDMAGADDRLFVVGEFQNVDFAGTSAARDYAFAIDTADDMTTWAPSFPMSATSVLVSDGDVYLGGAAPGGIGDLPYLTRTSVDGTGTLDGTWTPDLNAGGSAQYGQLNSLSTWEGNIIVGGRMIGSLNASDDGVAMQAFSTSAPVTTAWLSAINGRQRVQALATSSEGLYVGGVGNMAPDSGGTVRGGIALYSTPGTLVNWGPEFWSSDVASIAIAGGVVAIGGDMAIQANSITQGGFRANSPRFFLAFANAYTGGGGGGGGGGAGGETSNSSTAAAPVVGGTMPGGADLTFRMRPGEVGAIDNGVRVPVSSSASSNGKGIIVTGSNLGATLDSTQPLGSGGTLQPTVGSSVSVGSSGWAPGSAINGYVLSTPVLIGSTTTSTQGVGNLTLALPASLSAGSHTLQLSGTSADGARRVIAVGIDVQTTATRPESLGSRITFKLGSARINAAGKKALRVLVRQSQEFGGVSAVSVAALRSRGSSTEDRELASRRAKAVASFLQRAGIGVPVRAIVRPVRVAGEWTDRRVDVTVRMKATRTS